MDAAGHPDGLTLALRSTHVGGTSTTIGIYWEPPRIPFLAMFVTGITFHPGVAEARPLMLRILEMTAGGSSSRP